MMMRKTTAVSGVLVLLTLTGSCVLRGPSGIRRDVESATGARYEREFGMTVGRVSLAAARLGIKIAGKHDSEEMPNITLQAVRKLQLGVSRVKDGTWEADYSALDAEVLGDWEPMVRVHQDGEEVHVLTRTRDEELRALLVVVADSEELVIVHMKGRLDGVMEQAMRFALDEADREQYYEASLEQIRATRPDPAGS